MNISGIQLNLLLCLGVLTSSGIIILIL